MPDEPLFEIRPSSAWRRQLGQYIVPLLLIAVFLGPGANGAMRVLAIILAIIVILSLATYARPPVVRVFSNSVEVRRFLGTARFKRDQVIDIEFRPVRTMPSGKPSRTNRKRVFLRFKADSGDVFVLPAVWSGMWTSLGGFSAAESETIQGKWNAWINR